MARSTKHIADLSEGRPYETASKLDMQSTSQLRTANEETNKTYNITYISLCLLNWSGVVRTRRFHDSVVEDSVLLLVSRDALSKRREPLPSDAASLDPRWWRHYPLSKSGKPLPSDGASLGLWILRTYALSKRREPLPSDEVSRPIRRRHYAPSKRREPLSSDEASTDPWRWRHNVPSKRRGPLPSDMASQDPWKCRHHAHSKRRELNVQWRSHFPEECRPGSAFLFR